MEKLTEDDNQLTKVRRTNGIRCARAAFLISSLRNACIDSSAISSQLQDEKQIEELKINLVKETLKIKRLRFLIKVYFIVAGELQETSKKTIVEGTGELENKE